MISFNGHDFLIGGDGHDKILGSGRNDKIGGGSGADWLQGDSGNDYLIGDEGNDCLAGGEGADTLIGGAGHAWLTGGGGSDTFDQRDQRGSLDFTGIAGFSFEDRDELGLMLIHCMAFPLMVPRRSPTINQEIPFWRSGSQQRIVPSLFGALMPAHSIHK